VIVDPGDDARMCGCGWRGHLEAYASATAVIKRTREALEAGRSTCLSKRVAAGEELTPKLVAEEAQRATNCRWRSFLRPRDGWASAWSM